MPVRSSKVKASTPVPPHTCVQPCSMSHIDTHLIVGIAIGFLCGIATYAYGISYGVRMSSDFRAIPAGATAAGNNTPSQQNGSPLSFKATPVLTNKSASSTLQNAEQDLLKFQIASSNQASPIATKQFTVLFNKTRGVSLFNFRLMRGAMNIDMNDYDVTCINCNSGKNIDLKNGEISSKLVSGQVVVSFKGEETISGAGYVYTLKAMVAGAKSGQSVRMTLVPFVAGDDMTFGSLTNAVDLNGVSSTAIYHLDTTVPPDYTPELRGYFLWSDMSALPHSNTLGWKGGSSDWVNDLTTAPMTISSLLSL